MESQAGRPHLGWLCLAGVHNTVMKAVREKVHSAQVSHASHHLALHWMAPPSSPPFPSVPSFPMRPLLLVGSLSALPESVEVGRISDLRDRLLDFKPTAPVAVAVGMPQCKFRFRNGEPGAIQCRITIAQSRACTDFLIAVGALSSSSQFLNFFVFLCLRGLWLCDCGWQTCRLQGRREPATLQVGKMASQNPLGINADIDVDYSAF